MNSHTHNTHHHKHAHKKMAHMDLTVVLPFLSQQNCVCLVMIQNKKRMQSKKNL